MIKKLLFIVTTLVSLPLISQQQGTPIDLRLNAITATARESFAIQNDIANQRATSKTETNSVISDLKEQLRARRARIDQDVADLKKIIFADL